jgi:serine-type D-Ala-D-Ala endopeptidase (penicillin-binding protein 7)
MDLSIKLLKNAVNALVVLAVLSTPAFARQHKKSVTQPQNGILATNYIVKDLDTGEVLKEKNSQEIRSIASITKLMTAVVVLNAHQNLDEIITVGKSAGVHSRLPNGIKLSRSNLLLLALMSSDNVAAKTLAENYPGGEESAIAVMNATAISLGMNNTKFTDPTGLFAENVSTAIDLSKLIDYAYGFDIIRNFSTKSNERIQVLGRKKPYFVDFHTTNSLVVKNTNIGLSKTGWIQKSGGCLVMIVKNQGHRLAVILLNSKNTHTRIRDGVLLTEYDNVRNNRNFR